MYIVYCVVHCITLRISAMTHIIWCILWSIILKVYFPPQATLVQFSPHCIHGRWINIAGYTQTVNTCSETLYTNDCLRPACLPACPPSNTHCLALFHWNSHLWSMPYKLCKNRQYKGSPKIAIKSITSSCWLKLFSWNWNTFIANLVRLVCIPRLFLYHPNFVRAPANSCFKLFLHIFYAFWLHTILFSLHKSKEFHQCEKALDYIQRNQWWWRICICIYVLYCICICIVLYLYLWQPMMMERGLWNFACAQICLNLVTPLQCIVDHIICNSTFTQKQKQNSTIHWNNIQNKKIQQYGTQCDASNTLAFPGCV